MMRARLRHHLEDGNGNSVINALCDVYEVGTTTAVADMYTAPSGGSPVTTLVSGADGIILGWCDHAGEVDVKVTDHSGAASIAGISGTRNFPSWTTTVPVLPVGNDIVRISSLALDPRSSEWAGGAAFDGTTDDTAAWNALIASIGDTSTMRAVPILMPGPSKISSTLLFNKRSVHLKGRGWGATSGGSATAGSVFIWDGAGGIPMVRLQACQGARVERIRFMGKDGAKPSAGISNYNLSGDTNGNSFNSFDQLWFGPLLAFDGALNGNLTAGMLWEGDNVNNDQSTVRDTVAWGCDYGIKINNTQNLINKFTGLHLIACGVGFYTNATVDIDHSICLQSQTRDIYGNQSARVTLTNFASETSPQMALLENGANLIVNGGYWQIGNTLAGSGSAGNAVVIDATHNTDAYVSLNNFSFPLQNYTNPGTPAISMGPTSGNTVKRLITYNTDFGGVGAVVMTVGPAGGTREWTGSYHGVDWNNFQVCPSRGFNYDPVISAVRTDLVDAYAVSGLRLGDPALAQNESYDPSTGAKINGGPGVPSVTQCPAGQYWFRTDGGGAGSTHLYFNNAGSIIGVA